VVLPEGQPAVPLAQRPIVDVLSITEGYAAAMRIPLIEGREFTERDNTATGPHALLVNKTFARRFWPDQSALGKRVWVGRDPQPWEVAGVLKDVHNFALAADVRPEIDLPYALLPGLPLDLIVRTQGDPHAMTRAIEQCVFSLDHEQPVTAIQTMDEILESGAAQPRFTASLLAALAIAALVLAIIGIYGAISYAVTERTREVGIRLALGADRGDILRLVLARGAVLAGAGIAIGIACALALTRLLGTLLYHVSATDPFIFAAGAASFLLVALAASYIPARRATRIDPVETLR
jgi:putative ABC transport system permease protein